MAYNALNKLIDAYIYANGVQAITGQILNGVLKQMVSQLGSGYHLMGVAGPETVPASNDYAMAYFAATAGEYTDFGGITLAAGEVAVLLTSGNGSWSKQTIYNVPTGTADLENTANFITNAVTDLVNYYTKTEVDDTLANYPTLEALATALTDYYTKTQIDGQKAETDAALADRYIKSETDAKLADYYKKTETYDKDEVDSIIAALSRQEYIVAWDGLAAPDVSAIPAGVTVTYSGTTYTGTLAASASTVNKIYMVWNGTAYDMYGTSADGGYSWVPMGTTTVDLSQYAMKAEVSQLEAKVDGIKRTIDGAEANYAVGGWNTDGNNAGSSAWYRVLDYIPVSPGDTIVWNPGEVNGGIALVIYDSDKEYSTFRGANAVERTLTMPAGAAFIRPSFAKSTFASAKIIRNGAIVWVPFDHDMGIRPQLNVVALSNGVVTDASGGSFDTLTIANHKVILDSNGVKIEYFGKQLWLKGPFEMAYDSTTAPNGGWVIDAQTLEDAADGSSITATASIVKYASSGSSDMKNNVILFTCYFGRIYGNGLLGNLILKKQINIDINSVSILAIDSLNGSSGNVLLDKDNKKVVIKKEGIRLKLRDRFILLSGSEDFEMAFDSTNHPNGGWFLKTSAIQDVANGGSVALSSDNIVYYSVVSAGYNENILLFACYYGDIAPVGLLGNCILQLEIEDVQVQNVNIELDEAKCKQFAAYFNNSGICETFAFMTDPHLLGTSNVFNEVQFVRYIKTLAKYYDNTPVDWCVCGGDWLNNSDYQDIACWKLGYMDATMRKSFKHYFPVLGNHDTNYQGVVSAEDSNRGDLTHQTLINLMFRENGNTYYKFKGNNTQFYVFDTGIDWESEMNSFKWEQIDWFANALLADDSVHTVIIQHIFYTSGTTVNPMATNIQAIAGAYNSRTSITLNGTTYNFSGCTGKIACVIAGHSHFDAIVTEGVSVPVWLTTNMMDGNTPTFDLCIIDYTAGKMKSVRVGTGVNREMTLA